MKFLVLLLLAGIAFASAVPLQQNHHELERYVDEFGSDGIFESETESTLDEVKEKLKERVNEILKKIREVIDTGKLFQKETLEKLKELNEKLKRELGEEGFKKLRDNTAEILRKLLEAFGIHAPEHAEAIMAEAEQADISDIIKMKEILEELITKAKDAFDNGSTVTEYLEKIQQVRDTLKLLNIDLGEKAKEYLQVLKEKMRDYWNRLKEKLTTKRSADIDVFGMFEELKKQIKEKFDLTKVKEYIEKVFGKGSEVRETLLNWLKDKGGKQKILDFIDRILGEKETQSSISDYFQKVKNYFKELNIELHEKYAKFGHWVKERYEQSLEKGKDKAENLKKIAREFLHDTRMLSKHIAVEAKFFFKEYKNELGDLFGDVMKKIEKVLKNSEQEEQHSISDYFHKIMNYFKELNIELHEKYAKFGHWLKEQYEDIIEKGQSKEDSLKQIAREFLHDSRMLSKHIAVEAKFFFLEYKNELGDLFGDVMKKIEKVLENSDQQEQHSISDYFHKIKNYFKDLNIELHEKYAKFGHWLKEQYEDIIETGQSKEDSLKEIARQFLHDSRTISKHMAVEAKYFFTEYSKELGDMFGDVMKKIEKVLDN